MTETMAANDARFVAYEYTRIKIAAGRESLYRDTYANFGWELDDRPARIKDSDTVTLHFRRDRGISNRTAVTNLQRTCERALNTIARAERSVSSTAVAVAGMLGVVGAALLAGSIFALDADLTIVSIALGANGLLSWVAGYFAHERVTAKQSAKITPLIDDQHTILVETGEQARALLNHTSPKQLMTTS